MSEENSSLVSQCLDFCQTLATKSQGFNFILNIGSNFSFSLDTRIKNPTSVVRKKKSSPSTLRRNARRRQKFMETKNSTVIEETDKQTETMSAEISDSSLFCDICEFSANSKIALNKHMKTQHVNIDQLDGNLTWNSTPDESSKPEDFTETSPVLINNDEMAKPGVLHNIKLCEKHTRIASELNVNQVIPAGWPKSCRDCALLRCN